jgi:hypothetical protein
MNSAKEKNSYEKLLNQAYLIASSDIENADWLAKQYMDIYNLFNNGA